MPAVTPLRSKPNSPQGKVDIVNYDQKFLIIIPDRTGYNNTGLIHPALRFYQQDFFLSNEEPRSFIATLRRKSLVMQLRKLFQKQIASVMPRRPVMRSGIAQPKEYH
jgi:hypothetical protein